MAPRCAGQFDAYLTDQSHILNNVMASQTCKSLLTRLTDQIQAIEHAIYANGEHLPFLASMRITSAEYASP